MEFYSNGPGHQGHWFFIEWPNTEGQPIAELSLGSNQEAALYDADHGN